MPTGFYKHKPFSKETKQKIKLALLGNKNGVGNKSRLGQKSSAITRQKQREAKLGEKSHFWKGGRYEDYNGYVILTINDKKHHSLMAGGCAFEHRFVVEDFLGRPLTKQEVVHHINEIKNDNRLENLYLFNSIRKHLKFHFSKVKSKLVSNLQ